MIFDVKWDSGTRYGPRQSLCIASLPSSEEHALFATWERAEQ